MTLRRKTPLRAKNPWPPKGTPRTRLRPVSTKRAEQAEARSKVIEQTLDRAGRKCQAKDLVPHITCGSPFRDRPKLETHEVIPRDVYPNAHLDVENTVALCQLHHDWVTEHPTDAHAVGLHGYSWERTDGR